MRNLSVTAIFLFLYASLNAQVMENTRAMSLGSYPALVLEIKDTDVKVVEDVWKDFFGKFGKAKKNRKADEYVITDAEVGPLKYSRAVDVYAQIVQMGTSVSVATWMDMKGGFLNSTDYPEQYREAAQLMQEFDLEVRTTMVKNNLDEQEKLLSRLENDMKKLIRKNESLNKTIEDAKARIAKAEAEIVTNLAEQEAKKKEIEAQETTVKEVSKKLNDLGK